MRNDVDKTDLRMSDGSTLMNNNAPIRLKKPDQGPG